MARPLAAERGPLAEARDVAFAYHATTPVVVGMSVAIRSGSLTAVVGANGSGKTTLFEAIEWCLYGPRTISNADVFPRGRESKPQVQVTLEHPVDGRRYVIERRLTRSKTMQAQVWREDDPENILATGSAPVRALMQARCGEPGVVTMMRSPSTMKSLTAW